MKLKHLKTPADLEALFRLYNAEIFSYLMARVRSREVAEDIAQDVFIKAWQKRAQFDPAKGSLKNWLYAIALNTARDYWRANKHRAVVELPAGITTLEDLPNQAHQKATVEFIIKHLKSLPQKDQELLTLRFTQSLSLNEVSEIMNLNYSATKVALHRATEKLKKRCNRFLS